MSDETMMVRFRCADCGATVYDPMPEFITAFSVAIQTKKHLKIVCDACLPSNNPLMEVLN